MSLLIDILSQFGWQIVVLTIVIFFLVYFRKPIGDLIRNTSEIESKDIKIKIDKQKTYKPVNNQAMDLLNNFVDTSILKQYEDTIKSNLEKLNLRSDEEIQEYLIKLLAAVNIQYRFESIYKFIFSSQIDLLKKLNSSKAPVKNEDCFDIFYKTMNKYNLGKNYTPQTWIDFLSNFGLISKNFEGYYITKLGQEFLKYLITAQKNLELKI